MKVKVVVEDAIEAQQEQIKRLRTKINQLDDVFERTEGWRGDMEKSISDMEASLIARVNTASKEFQTQISTVLQERVDEESIAAKTFDKV